MYEENFGSLSLYKDYSMEIEKYNHPFWQKEDLQKEVYNIFKSLVKFRCLYLSILCPGNNSIRHLLDEIYITVEQNKYFFQQC